MKSEPNSSTSSVFKGVTLVYSLNEVANTLTSPSFAFSVTLITKEGLCVDMKYWLRESDAIHSARSAV